MWINAHPVGIGNLDILAIPDVALFAPPLLGNEKPSAVPTNIQSTKRHKSNSGLIFVVIGCNNIKRFF